MDVAKFSACFCYQAIDHPVCKSLVGTYDARYFSVEKSSLRLQLSREPVLKSVNFGAALRESDVYLEQFCTGLLHWLVSLSYVFTESPWGTRRMKV